MKYKSLTLIILCLIMAVQFVYAQSPKGKYIVFTFEYANNKSPHGKQIYYWIQSVDSVSKQQAQLQKLVLSGYSNSDLKDCCAGKSINPYTGTISNAKSYDFSKKYYVSLDTIEKIIKRYRKRVQIANKGLKLGSNELLNIYATPVEGLFCVSKFIPIRDREMAYKYSIFIPYSSFSYYKEFWKSEEYKFFVKHDYSLFLYSILPPD